MRILLPSIVDPAEARGGAWTVTRGLIAAMRLAWPGCEIDCVSLKALGATRHLMRQASSVAGSLAFGGLPAKMRFARTDAMRKGVSAAIAASAPDLIVLNGSDLIWLLDELPPGVPVVIVAHNIEQALYGRRIAALGTMRPLASRVLAGDFERMGTREAQGLARATAVIFLSDEDFKAANGSLRSTRAAVLPPVFDYVPRSRVAVAGSRIALGMFADFQWWPNRISLEWFLEKIWPSVAGSYHLHLMGHDSGKLSDGVRNATSHGYIDDPREAFARCDLMIAPIIDGGGVKVKVAEALYNGAPVLATPLAVKGLPLQCASAAGICDSAGEWISFLASGAAASLASRPVSDDLRNTFSLAAGARLLREFLELPRPVHS